MTLFKAAGLFLTALLMSCDVNINKNFNIADKSFVEKDLIAINGTINVGRDCVVEGTLSSINGSIVVEDDSKIYGDISTVNGSITLNNDISVDANIQSVNGFIQIGQNNFTDGNISNLNGTVSIGDRSEIKGDISNVSGDIELTQTVIHGDILSNFGDIYIENHSEVQGSIIIEDNNEIPEKLRKVKIILADSSIVKGDLKNTNRDVLVSIFIEPGSRVNGTVTDVEMVNSKEQLENF